MSRLPRPVRSAGARLIGWVPLPILTGPNAGRLWTLASAGRGYVTGRFERERLASMMALLRSGDRLWDVGAHKGFVALAAARRVGAGGHVLALEPAPANQVFLRRHIGWNRARVEVMPVALSDAPGESTFGGTGSSIAYRLGQGDQTVRVRTVAEIIDGEGRPPPTVLKLDVEGDEAAVLEGAGGHLERVELLFVAVHGRGAYDACREILDRSGFRCLESRDLRQSLRPGESWRGDPDLVAWRAERGLDTASVATLPAYT